MPRSLPPIQSPTPALTPSAAAHSLDPLEVAQRLARPELAAASQTDPSTLLVVDVRSRRRFARGHLPLSQPIPAGLLVSGEWPDGDLLLVGDGTGEAERVRESLHRAGYPRRILQLAGGIEASGWKLVYKDEPNAVAQSSGARGGGGADTFAFSNGLGGTSANVLIADFTVGTDRLALVGFGTNVSSILNTAVTTGGNTSLTLTDGTRVTLVGVGSTNGILG